MKEELRLGTMIGSSSVDDSYCDDSHSSFNDDGPPLLVIGSSSTITVSVLALPLASTVNLTSVRGCGLDKGDSGIAVRLIGA